MQIIAQCPACGTTWQLENSAADRRIKCRKCGRLFKVPKLEVQDINIINYDMCWRIEELYNYDWKMIVLDESQYLQNRRSKRTQFVSSLVRRKKIQRRMLLTGTPSRNGRPIEMREQLKILEAYKHFSPQDYVYKYCGAYDTPSTSMRPPLA